MVCAFTGHRPQRLAWGERESDARCAALKILLDDAIRKARARGFDTFLCGMARGADTYFAEAVLQARECDPQIRLVAMVPCPTQADAWPQRDRLRYRTLCDRADRVCVLEPAYSSGCMLRRNRVMVDSAQLLITVFDGQPGGTAATVRYAEQQGKEILRLWY